MAWSSRSRPTPLGEGDRVISTGGLCAHRGAPRNASGSNTGRPHPTLLPCFLPSFPFRPPRDALARVGAEARGVRDVGPKVTRREESRKGGGSDLGPPPRLQPRAGHRGGPGANDRGFRSLRARVGPVQPPRTRVTRRPRPWATRATLPGVGRPRTVARRVARPVAHVGVCRRPGTGTGGEGRAPRAVRVHHAGDTAEVDPAARVSGRHARTHHRGARMLSPSPSVPRRVSGAQFSAVSPSRPCRGLLIQAMKAG